MKSSGNVIAQDETFARQCFEEAVCNQYLACIFAPRARMVHQDPEGVRRSEAHGDDRAPEEKDSATTATVQQSGRKVAERRDLVEKLPAVVVTVGGRQVASNYCKQLRLMRRLTPPAEGWRERGCKCAE